MGIPVNQSRLPIPWFPMARFLIRTISSTLVTMILVSALLFLLMEVLGRSVSVQVLGIFATEEQYASYDNQFALDEHAIQRYSDWLLGSDWRAGRKVGYPVVTVQNPTAGENEWWTDVDGQYTRWRMDEGELVAVLRNADGTYREAEAGAIWTTDAD